MSDLHPNHLPGLRYALRTLERVDPVMNYAPPLQGDVRAAIVGMRYIIKRTEEAAALPAPVRGESEERIYVECRECADCGHAGINDDHPTDARCGACGWSGPPPKEDRCPECSEENVMGAACPKCSGRYTLIASADVAASAPKEQGSEADALGYATRLAEAIWSKHYQQDAPDWKPLPDLLGVLTQIDNMASGLAPAAPKEAQEPVAWVPYCHTDGETCIQGEYRWDEIAEKPCEMWDPEHWMCLPLYASPSQPQPGWRLVPEEPTEEMHAAAVRTIVRCTGNADFPPRVWRAMLSASPQPQPQTGGAEKTQRDAESARGVRAVDATAVPIDPETGKPWTGADQAAWVAANGVEVPRG